MANNDQQMFIHDLIPCARFSSRGAAKGQDQYLAPVFQWDGKNALVSWTPELLTMTGQNEDTLREGLVSVNALPGFTGYFYWSQSQQQILDVNQGTAYAMNRQGITTAGTSGTIAGAQTVGAGRGSSP